MTMYVTSRQYKLLLEILTVMGPFYGADFDKICEAIGTEYGVAPTEIRKAKDALAQLKNRGVIAPVIAKQDFISPFLYKTLRAKEIDLECQESGNKERFVRAISCSKEDLRHLEDVLDTYSRMMMGQFFPIYEQLDVPMDSDEHALNIYRELRWSGGPALDARNALIPAQAEMGWNGNFGICNNDVSAKSKLAYEMCKAVQYAGKINKPYVLHLTGQPLAFFDMAD